ncbi:acyl-CoA thioesterase [Haliangium sp.]
MSDALSPTFSLSITPDPEDIDELGHVSNLVYLRWVQDVAKAHSTAVGYDFEAYRAMGAAFVVRRHEIEYLRSALLGDRLVLRTWLASWKGASSVRMTSIVKMVGPSDVPDHEREVELARATTLWALVRFDSGRPLRIPDTLKQAFSRPLAGHSGS